jgi:hypothetical protein
MSKPCKLSPVETRLRASKAGLTGWANTKDRAARARHAQQGLYEKFVRAVDPHLELDEQTRHKNAQSLYRAHYQGMALKSATARRHRKEREEREERVARARKAARDRQARGDVA